MARCIVTIAAMADRMKGKSSKTGKDYDFCEVAVSYQNQWGNNAVAVASLDGTTLDKLSVNVGDNFDAVVNIFNGKTYIDLINEVY